MLAPGQLYTGRSCVITASGILTKKHKINMVNEDIWRFNVQLGQQILEEVAYVHLFNIGGDGYIPLHVYFWVWILGM